MSSPETPGRISGGNGGRGTTLLRKKIFWRLYVGGLAVLSLVSINFFIPGSSIKCVQCSSSQTPDCFENPPPARSCDKDMKFCRMTKETLPNGTVSYVERECIASDVGSACTKIPTSSADVTSTKCHWTCNSDGCNGAVKGQSPIGILLVSVAALQLWLFQG